MSHLRIFSSTFVPVGLSHLEPQIRQGESRREEERQRYNQEQQQYEQQQEWSVGVTNPASQQDNRTRVLDIAKTKKVAIKKPTVKKPRTKRILVPDTSMEDFKKDIISSLKQQSTPPASAAPLVSIEQKPEKPKIDLSSRKNFANDDPEGRKAIAARMQKAREAKERNKIKREEEMRQKIKKELETENMLLDNNKADASKSS